MHDKWTFSSSLDRQTVKQFRPSGDNVRFNPSVPDAPNWRIPAFKKRLREPERS